MVESNQNIITDRELLAICNLSNLRMEFANLIKDIDEKTGEIVTNHTIYSLLEKEIESIRLDELGKNTENPDGSKALPRVFMRKKENEVKAYSTVYNSIEYYEKYRLGNNEGKFLEEWELLYGGDGYKISTDYFKI
ncbi:hypothetical protein [Fusobacterium sp.]|uniref:hypothetical protein n=1 Tax=Fusobacterium sp. TaxID=68766 RepID=UPI0029035DDF|nr:hypothetical protein [Fusobacterium sp.]MDU1911580.1 hypothetical protein [Fusobacterium sp.]